MLYILFFLIVLTASALQAYTGRYQAVTLWAGKMIAPAGFENESPQGFQDAITPKSQGYRQTIQIVLWIVLFAFGTYLHWYLGFLGIFVALLLSGIFAKFFPSTVDHYLFGIIRALDNRAADYKKSNDEMRCDAVLTMSEKVTDLYSQVRGQQMPIPSVREIQSMANQG